MMNKITLFFALLFATGLVFPGQIPSEKSIYKTLTLSDVARLVKKEGFFSKCYDWNHDFCNPEGGFSNKFNAETFQGQRVVSDRASGLMWHQGGSYKSMRFKDALSWVDDLNRNGYAGFKDWRLPTLKEAATLLENRKMDGSLFVDPLFSRQQGWIWTGDICSSTGGGVVTFLGGTIGRPNYGLFFVRPVRTL